ncbi:hypothetical protein Hanom_Chr07g00607611 [Helianthus anomalus]
MYACCTILWCANECMQVARYFGVPMNVCMLHVLWCAARSKLNQTELTSYGWQGQVPLIDNGEPTCL